MREILFRSTVQSKLRPRLNPLTEDWNMPVFGNRMVVATANVNHIAKVKKETDERETRLAKWRREKEERKKNLNILHEKIRTNSITSNDSRAPPPPYIPDDMISSSRRGSSVSRKSSSASWKGPNLDQKGRSFSDVTLSPVSVPDTTEIVGGGRKRRSACANCTIQWSMTLYVASVVFFLKTNQKVKRLKGCALDHFDIIQTICIVLLITFKLCLFGHNTSFGCQCLTK